MYQVGLFFHAGFVTLWVNESVEIGTWDIAMNAAFSGAMSAAKSAAKCASSIHQLLLLSGLNALDACGRACSIEAQLSPSSRANSPRKATAKKKGALFFFFFSFFFLLLPLSS